MPTALELARDGWKPYVQAAQRRPTPPPATTADRRERGRLMARIREVAAVLKARLGARRVVLFGSLAHEAWFVPDSDVDLAVEGLTGDAYWQAWRVAEELIDDRPVDLIDIELASSSLRQAIERYGLEL